MTDVPTRTPSDSPSISAIKYMDIKEFRERGYLQEVNRRFFHPLGLALAIEVLSDGTERLYGIWDYRDDPEGIYFDDSADLIPLYDLVDQEFRKRAPRRFDTLGYLYQPVHRPTITKHLPNTEDTQQ